MFCEIIFCGHETLLFDDIGHVRVHLNLWTWKYMQYYLSEYVFCWDLNFVYCLIPIKNTKLNVQ